MRNTIAFILVVVEVLALVYIVIDWVKVRKYLELLEKQKEEVIADERRNTINEFIAVWEKYILGNKEDFTIGLSQSESDIRADAIRKFAEWMYKSQYHGPDADSEERKNYTISRWIEDFEKEQLKGE